MKIIAANRHGGNSNTDVVILAEDGGDLNVIDCIASIVLDHYKSRKCVEGSTGYQAKELAENILSITKCYPPEDGKFQHYYEWKRIRKKEHGMTELHKFTDGEIVTVKLPNEEYEAVVNIIPTSLRQGIWKENEKERKRKRKKTKKEVI